MPHSNPTGTHQFLLTGASGFVGKVVLAELLRQREALGVGHIYVIIREKRGKTPAQRFAEDIAPARVFRRLPANWTDWVTPIAGELTQPDAGLAASDLAMLHARVTHVIHCAASVEFELPIAQAADANITAALNMLGLARACRNLQRMVSVSTAYVTPWREGTIPEALVELPFDAEATYADILAGKADQAALMAATGHPNTYTLTKCLAEHLLVARHGDVPLSIVRPSIVSATLHHPEPGWLDSAAAFAGFVALVGSGHMKVMVINRAAAFDIVPCDVVSDVILDEVMRPAGEAGPHVRHAVTGRERTMNGGQCVDVVTAYFNRLPVDQRPDLRWTGPVGKDFEAAEWRHQTLPLRLSAKVLKWAGRAKQAKQASRLEAKLRMINRAFPYFTHHTFDFAMARPTLMPGFTAHDYIERVSEGVSRHLLKRDPSSVSLAGRAHRDGARSDLAWALKQPRGNAAVRIFGLVLRKAARQLGAQITYDHTAFAAARAQVPEGMPIVVVPTHRSYMDFLLCSYLFFSRPDLNVRIPQIAAAEEFASIPVLGKLFTMAGAFYLRRGLRREDPELTQRVHTLFGRGEVIEFFIEGARSRSRQFLAPRTGLMRCLQATGSPYAVLPVAISYDRVPEEDTLARELAGEAKPRMSLRGLLGWFGRLRRGEVALGRIHIGCAAPVIVQPDGDVREAASAIMAGLQSEMPVTTYHLRCFLTHAKPAGVDLAWLKGALERRGAQVLDSDLDGEESLKPVSELSLRQQWLHWFYDDALARWPHHPVLVHEAANRRWTAPAKGPHEVGDARLAAVLDALFLPLLADAALVLERIGEPAFAPRAGTPQALLPEVPGAFLLHAQAAFDCMVAAGVLQRGEDGKTHHWGPEADGLAALRARCPQGAPTDTPEGARSAETPARTPMAAAVGDE
jgi:1-acyl-sn-glycerol-3-phosphate acyltransferase